MNFEGSEIDALLEQAVTDGTFAGVCALIADRDGVLYEGSAGQADSQTIFRNASLTKALATVGALQLVEQGRLELEAPVESILPEFGELQVLEGFDGDSPRLRAPASKATIRQLMTHTSGCGYSFTNENLHRYFELTGLPNPVMGFKAGLKAPLVRDPGTRWEYGVSVDWLGLVVEAVSGSTLDVYLAEHLFGPLGMHETNFSPTPEQSERMIDISFRGPDGKLVPLPVELPTEAEWAAGGHGSCGTIGDYGRFIRAMLGNGELDGERVLDEETVKLAFSDQLRGVPLPEEMKSADPLMTNDVPVLPVPQAWGLGFHLVEVDVPGMRSRGTGDWAGLFNCFYWIDRSAGVGGVLMTQVLPFFDAKIIQTLLGLEVATYSHLGKATQVS